MRAKMLGVILGGTALVLTAGWFADESVFRWAGLSSVPDMRVSAEEIEAAALAVRERWPEFVKAFEARDGSHSFKVQARLEHEGQSDLLWLHVQAVDPATLHCILEEPPSTLYHLDVGDAVVVAVGEVRDWSFFTADGRIVTGGLSGVLMKRLEPH